jgi:FMN-dependent NADH-azoreductase
MSTTTATLLASVPVLLHIDASPRAGRSKSRQLGRGYVDAWLDAHPKGRVIDRDIGMQPPPFITEAWVEGAYAAPEQHSAAAKAAIAVSNQYVDDVLAADQIVITTPIHNLSLPAALKAWIDQIVRIGRTFGRSDTGFRGLAHGKRALIVVASGSDLRPETPGGAWNFLEPYLRAVLGFIGITDVQFVYAHSLSDDAAGAASLVSAQNSLHQLAAA